MTKPRKRAPARMSKAERELNQKRLAIMDSVLGRSRLMSKMAGIQYGGNRDIYAAAGYPAQGTVEFKHYWGLYTRGDVAGRLVDMPAKTTWKTPPEIMEEGENIPEDGTEFTKQFSELAERLRLWHYMQRVDQLAGIGRYAVLFIGTKGITDQQLKEPLQALSGPKDLIYLSVYHENNAEIAEWVTDTADPRFGLPKVYKLKITGDSDGKRTAPTFKNSTLMVHASRVIHVAENLLEDDTFGRPRLERPLNRLYDLDKVAASTGEAYWQLVSRILQAKIDPTVEIEEAQLTELDEKLQEMVHDLRRQFTGQGVELGWLGGETPNVDQVADFYFSLIAGASGIPKRILFGSEMGELASTTDQETYMGTINERQEQFAEPSILRAFIDRMISVGGLPKPKTGKYTVMWPVLFETPDKDRAETSYKRAQAAAALAGPGGNPMEFARINAEGDVELVEREPDEPTTPEERAEAEAEVDDAGADDDSPGVDDAGTEGGRGASGGGSQTEE